MRLALSYLSVGLLLVGVTGCGGCGGGSQASTDSPAVAENGSAGQTEMPSTPGGEPSEPTYNENAPVDDGNMPADAAPEEPFDPYAVGETSGTPPGVDPGSAPGYPSPYTEIPGTEPGNPSPYTAPPGTDPGYPGSESAPTTPPGGYVEGSDPSQPGYGNEPRTFTLAELAQQAFRQRRDSDAFQYLYADALTAQEPTAEQLNIKWVAGLKRPALGVRWGIGVQYEPARGYQGPLFPIGTTQQPQERGRESRTGNRGGGADYAAAPVDNFAGPGGDGSGALRDPVLAQFTGELGEKILARWKTSSDKGVYGSFVKKTASGAAGRNGENIDGTNGYAEPGYDAGNADIYGAAPDGNGPGAARKETRQITTGLASLGLGETAELLRKAAEEGLDVLLVIEVSVSENVRNGLVTNAPTLALYDVHKGERLNVTKCPNNLQVQFVRDNPKAKDPVEPVVEELFAFADKNLSVGEMPALAPDIALRRVNALASGEHKNPLPVLTEMRHYHHGKLLSDAELSQAYQRLIGEQKGTALAGGPPDQKLQAIDGYLPAGHPPVKLPGAAGDAPRGVPGIASSGQSGGEGPKPPPPVGFPSIPAETPPAEAAPARVDIPGLGLSLVPPPGFEVVRDGETVSLKSGSAQVTVERRAQPLAAAAAALTPDNLAKADYTLITKQDLPLAGREGVLAVAKHKSGYSYWFALVKQSDEETIAITAMCPDNEVPRLADSLSKALMSAQLGE